MLTWMQHHKKYLIVTIWISVIAFVGAGFVGWGSYSMNKSKSSAVARVGNSYIIIKDYNQKYSAIFNYYNSIFQGKFTQEQAEEAKLKDLAMDQIIQEQMFLNFAKELGLEATKSEVLDAILYDKTFYEDGRFSKEKYLGLLKQNGFYASDYEDSIKRELTLGKLFSNLESKISKDEVEALSAADFIEDELSIKIIKADDNISVSDEEVQAYWEKNKDRYKTLKSYEVEIAEIKPEKSDFSEEELQDFYAKNRAMFIAADDTLLSFEDAKEQVQKELALESVKENALKDYIAAKKGEFTFPESKIIDKKSDLAKNLKFSDIEAMSVNEVLKPIKSEDAYILVKLSKIIQPENQSFESAKFLAALDVQEEKTKLYLTEEAQKSLENFEGTNIGFINLNKASSIEALNSNESRELINKIKSQNVKTNFVLLKDKAVIYDIINQRINFDELNSDANINFLEEKAKNIKNNNIKMNILKELSRKYRVVRYF